MPALYQICQKINQGLRTPSHSCLGGGWLSVGEKIAMEPPCPPAYLGLQATVTGPSSLTWGASQLCIKITTIIINHSVARHWHTAWTPPSLPNSIVLLGGIRPEARLNAEMWPGRAIKYFKYYASQSQVTPNLIWNTLGFIRVEFPTRTPLSWPEAMDTIMSHGERGRDDVFIVGCAMMTILPKKAIHDSFVDSKELQVQCQRLCRGAPPTARDSLG